ncbi:MAG: acylneuraminate cytidylyltransferase family protein [Armatimonadetes bacterium]|nr:acylneuraminate cytidylyltransferase family protein [Armatimonadota bacterium]
MISIEKLNILALIPARGGSKGVPRKNIIKLGKYPLIAYSIAAAKLSKYINRTIVTTDDKKIADVSKRYGAEIPFMRPKELAKDDSLDIGFFKHALSWLKDNENYEPDYVVQLRPTTPLREIDVIDNAIETITNNKVATSLRSAHKCEKITGYKLFRIKDKYIKFFGEEDFKKGEEYYNLPRQVLPKTYNPNGYIDVIIPKILDNTNTLHGKNIIPFITPEVPDIDILKDVEYAERVINKKKFYPLIKELRSHKYE